MTINNQLPDKQKGLWHTVTAAVKNMFRPGTEQNETSSADFAILASYQDFVDATTDRYIHDFKAEASASVNQNFYNRFWKTFYDELLGEVESICELNRKEVQNPEALRTSLRKLAEAGLANFKMRTAQA